MEKSLATRLELLKQGVKPELILESKGASGGARLHKAFFPLSEGTKRSQKFEFFGNRLFLDFERQSDPPGPPKAIAP